LSYTRIMPNLYAIFKNHASLLGALIAKC